MLARQCFQPFITCWQTSAGPSQLAEDFGIGHRLAGDGLTKRDHFLALRLKAKAVACLHTSMQIVLPPELEQLIQRQLAAGKYQSALAWIIHDDFETSSNWPQLSHSSVLSPQRPVETGRA